MIKNERVQLVITGEKSHQFQITLTALHAYVYILEYNYLIYERTIMEVLVSHIHVMFE